MLERRLETRGSSGSQGMFLFSCTVLKYACGIACSCLWELVELLSGGVLEGVARDLQEPTGVSSLSYLGRGLLQCGVFLVEQDSSGNISCMVLIMKVAAPHSLRKLWRALLSAQPGCVFWVESIYGIESYRVGS